MSCSIKRLRGEVDGKRRSRGVAAVEFVISVPILIFVMLAAAEFGRAFVHYDTLAHTIRDSARYVSENAIAGTTGVVDITPQVAQNARNLAVYGNIAGTGDRMLPGLAPGHVDVVDAGGGNIEVIVNYPYNPMIGDVLPLLGGGSSSLLLPFQISVTMKAIS
ncbi:MAG: pilus assembly protein [Gammaproteobacteria bacterium]|nr:pilus assembly protein [Gammaproteobacteria bacterium]